jgi:hypothetical protein
MDASTRLKSHMWRAAQYRAASFGYEITPSCEHHLRPFLEDGIDELMKAGQQESAANVAVAEANVFALVTRMVIEAQVMHLDALHEPTFFAAKQFLCPLWPFC